MPSFNSGLTTFRFFAFFAVFLFHNLVFPIGYLGVQAFFVLSGFLITTILVDMKKTTTVKNYFLSFYGRRILRIFPVYYFYLLLVALVALPLFLPDGHSGIPRVDRFYHQLPWAVTYTYNFFHASDIYKHTHLLSHFWSLAVEEQFYLVWPLLIFLVPEKKMKFFLLALIILGPCVRWMTGLVVKAGTIPLLGTDVGVIVYVLPLSQVDAFAAGGFFALFVKGGSLRTIPLLLCVIIALGVLASIVAGGRADWLGLGYSNFMQESLKYVWGYSLFNLFFAFTLASLRDQRKPLQFMESPTLVYLGSISYGLYIFHNAFIWLVGLWLPSSAVMVKMGLSFSLTLLCSALSYALLEKPCLALKERFFPKVAVVHT